MKLLSRKLQFWEWKKPPVGAGTFYPSPMLVFYIPPCWKRLRAWRNVRGGLNFIHFVFYYTRYHKCGIGIYARINTQKDASSIPATTPSFVPRLNLWKIPEPPERLGIWGCTVYIPCMV
jgi:hypothetical protein